VGVFHGVFAVWVCTAGGQAATKTRADNHIAAAGYGVCVFELARERNLTSIDTIPLFT
jgi:hypothetical protein